MTISPRHANLRAEATTAVLSADNHLTGMTPVWPAWRAVIYDRPKTALRRIAAAEEHLRKAKRALRAWARSKA